MPDELDAVEEAVGTDRRTFIKRLVIGTAFAAPVVSSFTMSGVGAVFGTSLGASTMMAPNATAPPPPSMYGTVTCSTYTNQSLFTMAVGSVILNANSGGPPILPDNSTICLYNGNLTALQSLFPANEVPVSAWAVKWNVLSPGSPVATTPFFLRVNDGNVTDGDPIYAVDSGTPVIVGVATSGFWQQSFTTDPAFVVTHTTPAPDTPPASGGGSVPGETPGETAAGGAGTGSSAAAAVSADPSTTG